MDKFQDRIVIICKKFYNNWIFEELASDSHQKVDTLSKSITARINADAALFQVVNTERYNPPLEPGQTRPRGKKNLNYEPDALAQPYIQPKLQTTAGVGDRIVSGGINLPTTPISSVLARCLKLLLPIFDAMWLNLSITYSGITLPRCSIIQTFGDLAQRIQRLNTLGELEIINLAGGHLYTTILLNFTLLYSPTREFDLSSTQVMIEVGIAYTVAQVRRNKPKFTQKFMKAAQCPSYHRIQLSGVKLTRKVLMKSFWTQRKSRNC